MQLCPRRNFRQRISEVSGALGVLVVRGEQTRAKRSLVRCNQFTLAPEVYRIKHEREPTFS